MSTPSQHRFCFPIVRPFDGRRTTAPVRPAPPVAQRQLVEQSLLRCPPHDGGTGSR